MWDWTTTKKTTDWNKARENRVRSEKYLRCWHRTLDAGWKKRKKKKIALWNVESHSLRPWNYFLLGWNSSPMTTKAIFWTHSCGQWEKYVETLCHSLCARRRPQPFHPFHERLFAIGPAHSSHKVGRRSISPSPESRLVLEFALTNRLGLLSDLEAKLQKALQLSTLPSWDLEVTPQRSLRYPPEDKRPLRQRCLATICITTSHSSSGPKNHAIRAVAKLPGSSPGSPVVTSLPANAGDTDSIPGPGWFHMLRSN